MDKQKSPTVKRAKKHFIKDYNCAQSILLTMSEHFKLHNDLIPKIATAFGGGIGRCGSLCGALTGGVMVIGMRHGTSRPGVEKRMKAYRLARTFYERFVQQCGSPLCRELIGYDLSQPKELEKARELNVFDKKCPILIEKAVEILLELESAA
ncbi:MAG: C_GCAxxG_C_C family protein [Candidatus Bathyarchaeota archaeon]|jgi:C_GCAxxG_C_C family probable redox protein|nr:MAG: C_GCAxxG_C_C family protein [Candidatus Bathyarchaeota archaeon]